MGCTAAAAVSAAATAAAAAVSAADAAAEVIHPSGWTCPRNSLGSWAGKPSAQCPPSANL